MDVATDLVVFSWDGSEWKILLIKRAYPPFEGKWALPGGFVERDEDLAEAAIRELQEETGVHLKNLFQVGAFGKPDRDPRKRVISITYCAILHEMFPTEAGDDAAESVWFSLDELPDLAFDHDNLLRIALQKIQDHYRLKKHLPASGALESKAIHTFMATVLS